jgi:hypothetical protein
MTAVIVIDSYKLLPCVNSNQFFMQEKINVPLPTKETLGKKTSAIVEKVKEKVGEKTEELMTKAKESKLAKKAKEKLGGL